MPTMITDHLAYEEFGQPAGYGQPATPYPLRWVDPLEDDRLVRLCRALERIRAELSARCGRDVPITILSGYRSPAYDAARRAAGHTGVAEHSQHGEGRAADIRAQGCDPLLVHQVALELYRGGLLQIGGLGLYQRRVVAEGWVHVDIREGATLAQWTG